MELSCDMRAIRRFRFQIGNAAEETEDGRNNEGEGGGDTA